MLAAGLAALLAIPAHAQQIPVVRSTFVCKTEVAAEALAAAEAHRAELEAKVAALEMPPTLDAEVEAVRALRSSKTKR